MKDKPFDFAEAINNVVNPLKTPAEQTLDSISSIRRSLDNIKRNKQAAFLAGNRTGKSALFVPAE